MKKFFNIVFVVCVAVFAVIVGAAVKKLLSDNQFISQRAKFENAASAYLEQKYNINISECMEYADERIEYQAGMLDGGYFYSTPQYGVFLTDAGEEIVCVCKDGIYSDDRRLDELYSLFYDFLSEQTGADVRYVSFRGTERDTYGGNNFVDRSIGTYLEKNTRMYNEKDIDVFADSLFAYLGSCVIEIYAVPGADTTQELLLENIENLKAVYNFSEAYINVFDTDIGTKRTSRNGTIDDGELYINYPDSDPYGYVYMVICNGTGTRIAEK